MYKLGLDPGTKCGWALLNADNELIGSGVWNLQPKKKEGPGVRYTKLLLQLNNLIKTFGVDIIFYEDVRRHLGTDAAHVYGGIIATIQAWAEFRGIPYKGIPVATIKKCATGNGRAEKWQMVEAANIILKDSGGDEVKDDNEADAIFIVITGVKGLTDGL